MTRSRDNATNVAGDISGVTAGTGLSGGGTGGTVTLNLSTPVAATNGGTGLSTFTTGDIPYASASNTLAKLAIGSTDNVLKVSGGVPVWAAPAASVPANAVARVETNQFTGSTTYTDLTTSGPAVTLTTGTKALVIITANLYAQGTTQQARMSYAVSGASTIAASDDVCLFIRQTFSDNNQPIRASAASAITLTAGSNTFTAKYRWDGSGEVQQAHFDKREIFVINLE